MFNNVFLPLKTSKTIFHLISHNTYSGYLYANIHAKWKCSTDILWLSFQFLFTSVLVRILISIKFFKVPHRVCYLVTLYVLPTVMWQGGVLSIVDWGVFVVRSFIQKIFCENIAVVFAQDVKLKIPRIVSALQFIVFLVERTPGLKMRITVSISPQHSFQIRKNLQTKRLNFSRSFHFRTRVTSPIYLRSYENVLWKVIFDSIRSFATVTASCVTQNNW